MDSPATLTSHGVEFDRSPDKFGWITESSDIREDGPALAERMASDGYIFIRDYLDKDVVTAARREILERLASVDEIETSHGLMEGIASGRSTRGSLPDTRAFGNDLRNGPALKALVHDGRVIEFYEAMLGGEVRPLDHIWLRNVRVGGATGCHYDVVYMGRGTLSLYTSWIPIGDVPYSDGALMLLENSHTHDELRDGYGATDVDSGKPNPWGGWFSKDPIAVQDQYGGRWLTADDGGYRLGDLLVFGMFNMHCSLDNVSPVNRIRITSDTRYQLASEPADERWVGEDPIGHDINKKPA